MMQGGRAATGWGPWMLLLVLAGTAAPTSAQSAALPDSAVRLTADLGLVQTSGNTDVTTINIGERLVMQDGKDRLEHSFGIVYGRADGVTNASLWRGDIRYTRRFSLRLGTYALFAYDRNRFAGISRRFEEGAGLSLTVLDGARNRLRVESGISLFQQRPTIESGGLPSSFAAARGALTFEHRFSEKARFTQFAEVLPNLQDGRDLRINAESALIAPLSSHVAMKATYVVRFDNLPEDALETTDRILTSGLQFSF